jgi:hypothetical protein
MRPTSRGNQPGDASALHTLEGFFMLETQIATDKVRAYRASDYRIGDIGQSTDIVLSPGLHSEPLARFFLHKGVNCGALITAYNPLGVQRSEELNVTAHECLGGMLTVLDKEIIEGSGSEEGSDWPAEKSYFALGLIREDAIGIGCLCQQDAIIWTGENAVPELVLLR